MSYWSTLYIIGVRIKPESVVAVKRRVRHHKRLGDNGLGGFLDCVTVDDERRLDFRRDADDDIENDEYGSPVNEGKWYRTEEIAAWLKGVCEGGRIVFHSQEFDGCAWGWEFDGKGKSRPLGLIPCGRWS